MKHLPQICLTDHTLPWSILHFWKLESFLFFLIVITFLLPKLNGLIKIKWLFKEKGIYKIRKSLTLMIISCLGKSQKRTTTINPKPNKINIFQADDMQKEIQFAIFSLVSENRWFQCNGTLENISLNVFLMQVFCS